MSIEVFKFEIKTVTDASEFEQYIIEKRIKADEVVAIIGKTEGNGGVNDFTRILSDQAYRTALLRQGTRNEAAVKAIPMIWSGGCDGVIAPHATVFVRNGKHGSNASPRLVMGTAMSDPLLAEDIGRPAMVEKVAAGVQRAMKDAGINNPKDVHYVQTKTPLLTIDSVQDAHRRGKDVACEVHESMGVSNGTAALGIAVALGEVKVQTTFVITLISIRRLRHAPRALSSTVHKSCYSETSQEPAAVFESVTASCMTPSTSMASTKRSAARALIFRSVRVRRTSTGKSLIASSSARRTDPVSCGADGKSCWMIPMCTTIAIQRQQSVE
jgi:ring-opening amidohydrolase-like protein